MKREEAIDLLDTYVTSESLRKHCLGTAAVMKRAGAALGEDADRWEVIGILHDIDFELIDEDMGRHGMEGERILLEHGVGPDIAAVVRRHNHMLHANYTEPVEIALQASDSVSGLVIACALVKGGRITEVTPKTVKKKFGDRAFAAGCSRDRIRMMERLMDLPTFYRLAIDGLSEIRRDLDLS
jgi:putative nucleotidyltransferase with HDIG domain